MGHFLYNLLRGIAPLALIYPNHPPCTIPALCKYNEVAFDNNL